MVRDCAAWCRVPVRVRLFRKGSPLAKRYLGTPDGAWLAHLSRGRGPLCRTRRNRRHRPPHRRALGYARRPDGRRPAAHFARPRARPGQRRGRVGVGCGVRVGARVALGTAVGVSVGTADGDAVGLGLTFEFGADGMGVTVGDGRVGLAAGLGVANGLLGAVVATGWTVTSLPSEPARMLATV
jgi:hypothetical protein